MAVFAPTIVPLTLCCGRLTTESGEPVSASDRASQATLYFTPFTGNQVALHDGAGWFVRTFAEASLALSGLTSGKNYDVFGYDNAGVLALELSAAWTSDTARADALALQDGVWTKSGASTRRYLGTIRTTATTTTEDSLAKRFVWNAANRLPRPVFRNNASTYDYSSSTLRQMNADAANQIEIVHGLREEAISLSLNAPIEIGLAEQGTVAIGENSTTAVATNCTAATLRDFSSTSDDNKRITVLSELISLPRLGYSAYTMLERADSGTITLTGNHLRGVWRC